MIREAFDGNELLVPRYLPVQHKLFAVVIELNDRITPTEIRI